MTQNRSRDDFIRFLEYLGDKGMVPQATASARRTAAFKVLSVLSDDEAQDIIGLDIDHVMSRFDNLNPRQYTPESLQSYRSRLKTALEDFRAYSENPVSFKPNGKARQRPKQGSVVPATSSKKSQAVLHATQSSGFSNSPAVDLPNVSQLPIQLRQSLIVRIFGLPFDLTKQEAQKIANIVLAHAAPE